jgi:hypothetical protein
MPYLGFVKQRLADRLGSAATKGEGQQNMLCTYVAGALLVGLVGSAAVAAGERCGWGADALTSAGSEDCPQGCPK